MPNVCTPSGGTAANACFAYGSSTASFNNGRMTQMNDPTGSESYSYDALGRTLQMTKVIAGVSYPVSYAYDYAGDLKQITYPSGRIVQQTLDSLSRLNQVSSGGTNYIFSMAYNSAGQPTAFSYGNGVAASFSYNSRMQLQTLAYAKSGSNLFSVAYGYTQNGGNNGQITTVIDNVDSTRTTAITYDAWFRLKSWSNAQATITETYDRYGNRLTQSLPVPNNIAVDPATNHITTAGYVYDAAGNMANDTINLLTYDGENRAVTSTQSGATYAYAYDANGLRVEKTPPAGSPTVYVFSGSKVLAEYTAGAAAASPSTEYIYSGSQLAATITGTTTTYHHPDHLSTRVSTDSAGNTARTFGHYPFGEVWYETGTASKWKFTTYERDSESGNDYARARIYSNRLGRFASPDPLPGSSANPQSLNHYSYAANDPTNLVDPSGLYIGVPSGCYSIYPVPGGPGVMICNNGGGGGGGTPDRTTLGAPDIGGWGPPSLPNLGPTPQPPPPPGYEDCIVAALEAMIAHNEGMDNKVNSGYGVLVQGTITGTPDGMESLIGQSFTGQAYLSMENPEHLSPDDGFMVHVGGSLYSSAFGRFQITMPTAKRLGMTSMSPTAQRSAVRTLMDEKGMIEDAMKGQIAQAIWDGNGVWASLPDSPYNQHPKGWEETIGAFRNALNALPECQ